MLKSKQNPILTFCIFTVLLFFGLSGNLYAACGSSKVGVGTRDKISCLPARTCGALRKVADTFGSVTIVSGLRNVSDNRRRGGAQHSMHIQCRAADFLVPNHGSRGVQEKLARVLAGIPGTRYNVYCTGRAHVDDSDLANGYDTCLGGKSGKKHVRKHISKRRLARNAHKQVKRRG